MSLSGESSQGKFMKKTIFQKETILEATPHNNMFLCRCNSGL